MTTKTEPQSFTRNLLVAAIDFGTTYSGWAYSFYHDFISDPTKAYSKQWNSGSGTLVTDKTPTVLLVKADGKTLEAFGYDAENRYKDLAESETHTEYYYFRRFKMKLLTETLMRDSEIADEMGKSLPALDVFAMAIKYMRDDLRNAIRLKLTESIKELEIHWVLTVPAIWTDRAKQFMREAAEKAGIARDKLSIALEPEAASVYCRHLSIDKTKGSKDVSLNALPAGTKYMVLDAGGGTIDITVHEVVDDIGVKEVTSASGGGWGGTLIDREFETLLQNLVGYDNYLEFKFFQTEDWLDMMREFEVTKRNIKPETGRGANVTVRFPASLGEICERYGRDLGQYIAASTKYRGKVKLIRGKIKFESELFKQMFEESYSKIIEHVESILQKRGMEDVSLILMVGGYSESPMLQKAIITQLPEKKVVIPNEASSAILRGALIYGHRPEFITHRVLKYTYGVEASTEFIKGKHPEFRRFTSDIGDMCDNIFSKHVEKGTVVKVNEIQTKVVYLPVSRLQEEMSFSLYSSTLENPEYCDIGCTKIGAITVDTIPGDLECDVGVQFIFGGTEIEVEAYVAKTKQKVKVAVDLLSKIGEN